MSIAKTHSSANLRSSAPASVAFFLLAASTVAFAGPGDLDSSFGDGGRVFIDIPGASDFAATVILQQDGKLLIGRGNDADDDDFSVLRLNADGSFDETFGADGRTSLDAPGIKGTTRIVLLQPDGRIVAAGGVSIPGAERTGFGMARFNTDGSVDSSFGIGGVVTHDLGSAYEAINAVVLQSDGRLAAAGHTWSDVSRDMTFWRFNADGTLDTSFGTSGSTVINFHGSNGPDWSRWLGQQDDGKLIGVGTAWPSNPTWSSDVAVVRLNPDGLRDTTFDADGLVTVDYYAARHDLGSWYVEAGAAALRPDGTIVVAANTHYNIWDYGDTCIPMLAGLTADGSLDTGFGEGGPLQYQFPFCADIKGMVLGPNGDLYSAGALWIGRPNPMVARFTADGQLDLSYGAGGVSVVDAGQGERAGHAGSNSIVLQPDGKVVVVATTPAAEGEGSTLIVARLVEEGTFPGVLGLHTVQWWRDIAEAEDPFPVYVHRTGGSSGTVSVDYETSGGSAISGVDFSPASGTLTWSDGDVGEKLISIGINNDAEIENSESFTLTLSNPSGGVSLGTTELTLRIEDDDPGGQPNSPPAGPSASGANALSSPRFSSSLAGARSSSGM